MFIKRSLLLIIGIVIVIVMLGVGIGLAFALNALGQQRAANTTLSATVTAQTQAAMTPVVQAQPGSRSVKGVVQSLGTQSFTMKVTLKKVQRTVTVNVNAQTHYKLSAKDAAFSDLKVGETVMVVGQVDLKALTMQAMLVVIAPKAPTTPTPTTSPTATATP